MNAAEVLEALEDHEAIRHGHFHLSSGLHSDLYVQCALVLQWPGIAERLGHELGTRFEDQAPTVVLGPAMGGIVIGHEVARYLGVRMVFPERVEDSMTLRRGFSLEPHDRVLVIEDVITTGRSPREAVGLVQEAGAEVVGVGALVDRSDGGGFGARFSALLSVQAERWPPEECPLCRDGVELQTPGSRLLR